MDPSRDPPMPLFQRANVETIIFVPEGQFSQYFKMQKKTLLLVPFALLIFIGGMLVSNAIHESQESECHRQVASMRYVPHVSTANADFRLTSDGEVVYMATDKKHPCHSKWSVYYNVVTGRRLAETTYEKMANLGVIMNGYINEEGTNCSTSENLSADQCRDAASNITFTYSGNQWTYAGDDCVQDCVCTIPSFGALQMFKSDSADNVMCLTGD